MEVNARLKTACATWKRRINGVVLAEIRGVNFCSNDYLGLASGWSYGNAVLERSRSATSWRNWRRGCFPGIRRFGRRWKQEFAKFAGTEAALFFGSGYAANIGLLSSVLRKRRRGFFGCVESCKSDRRDAVVGSAESHLSTPRPQCAWKQDCGLARDQRALAEIRGYGMRFQHGWGCGSLAEMSSSGGTIWRGYDFGRGARNGSAGQVGRGIAVAERGLRAGSGHDAHVREGAGLRGSICLRHRGGSRSLD